MEKKFRLLLKSVILSSLILPSLGLSKGEYKIVLPLHPWKENDKNLLGIDSNKNGTRDDLEHFIHAHITRNPDVYRAWLQFLSTEQEKIVAYRSLKNLKMLEKKNLDNLKCLKYIYARSNEIYHEHFLSNVMKNVYNTTSRKEVGQWVTKNQNLEDFKSKLGNSMGEEGCRFTLNNLPEKRTTYKIVLPPDPGPRNEDTLLGIDSNKNGVRDDVEIYIYKKITKDPDIFRAWLQISSTDQKVLAAYPDLKKVKDIEIKDGMNDTGCLSFVYSNSYEIKQPYFSRHLINLIYNTKQREDIINWKARNWNSMNIIFELKRSPPGKETCHFY